MLVFMEFKQKDLLEGYIAKGNVLHSYLVLHADKEDRKKLLLQIGERIALQNGARLVPCEGKDWESIYQLVSTPSLWQDKEVLLWDIGKGVKEEVLHKIQKYIMQPSPWVFLVMGADSYKPFASWDIRDSKECALLDLSAEKPWEKEKRQIHDLVHIVASEGKDITQTAIAKLLSLSKDSFALESELRKVLAYIGDRKTITETDIIGICSLALAKGWQIAEEILWDRRVQTDESMDTSAFLGVLGQVRYLAQQARDVGWLLQSQITVDEISKCLGIKPQVVQKILAKIRAYDVEYLSTVNGLLYDVEMLAKNSQLDTRFLFSYLCLRLFVIKGSYDKSKVASSS